jgi:hypothetical protein
MNGNNMNTAYRITILIILALLAGPLYALTINLLIMANVFDSTGLDYNLGEDLSHKAAFIWMGSLVFGIASLFTKNNWQKILVTMPLVAPSLFAILYALSL